MIVRIFLAGAVVGIIAAFAMSMSRTASPSIFGAIDKEVLVGLAYRTLSSVVASRQSPIPALDHDA
jgi:hypothetical protein